MFCRIMYQHARFERSLKGHSDFDKAKFFAKQCSSIGQVHPFPLPENQPPIFHQSPNSLFFKKSVPAVSPSRQVHSPPNSYKPCPARICSSDHTPSVSYQFNLSVSTGVFPAAWEHATVVPLFKIVIQLRTQRTTVAPRCYRSWQRSSFQPVSKFGFMARSSTTMQRPYLTNYWREIRMY